MQLQLEGKSREYYLMEQANSGQQTRGRWWMVLLQMGVTNRGRSTHHPSPSPSPIHPAHLPSIRGVQAIGREACFSRVRYSIFSLLFSSFRLPPPRGRRVAHCTRFSPGFYFAQAPIRPTFRIKVVRLFPHATYMSEVRAFNCRIFSPKSCF